jgi:hypothetical protein
LTLSNATTPYNTFAQTIALLTLTLKQTNTGWRGPCPCGNGGDRALVVTEGKGAYCFGAQKGGDQIWLVSHAKDIPVKEAAELLANKPERKSTSTAEPVTGTVTGFKPLDLEYDHPAVAALGFSPEDAEQLGIGYAGRGIMKGLVALPIRLSDGTLAGYVGVEEIAKLPPRWQGLPENKVVKLRA